MEHLPSPRQRIWTRWDFDEVREAVEKSRAALLNNLSSISTVSHNLLNNLANVENLFLVDTTELQKEEQNDIRYGFYGVEAVERRAWEWGSRDMMFDFRLHDDDASPTEQQQQQERMAILTAAANLTGRAVHLINLKNLTEEEERGWVEALSLAADHHAGPHSLVIYTRKFRDAHGFLSALKKNKRLKHLSLQWIDIRDECIEVLRDFASLTSLHLDFVYLTFEEEFNVGRLAELHPSHSPLAASLERLHIYSHGRIDWRKSTGFLRHWPHLKELSLFCIGDITEEEVMDFMDHLAPPKKGAETAGNTPSSPPQLYSLKLGRIRGGDLSRSATAAVVDALSRSGLPFFYLSGVWEPAIEAQLWRNQHNYMLGSDLKRVPATSMRLFICGDPFAGKTTLVSTMCSIYALKRDKLKALLTGGRTQGIEVQAIKKDGIRVSVWDMAGQQQFHAFHDCMFPDIGSSSYNVPSMFMFVWSPMDSETSDRGAEKRVGEFNSSFRYWLKFLASKSRQSNIAIKVIVVITRSDQVEFVSQSLSPSIDSLRSKFKWVIDIVDPAFDVDARKKDSVKAVGECIFRIAKEVLEGIELYDICTQVSKHLWNHLKSTNEQIITWTKFSQICNIGGQLSNPTPDKAKLNIIALSLNESGNIVYINKIKHIVLDPNWFCNQIMGNLIGFPNSKGSSKGTIVFENGYIPRHFLEQKFECIIRPKVNGSMLVELMEAMHLCCKVPKVPDTTGECIFIPAILSKDEGREQPQWTPMDDEKHTLVYMGRRLGCENNDCTFLTPGLFPRIQVLFNNAFQSEDDKAEVTLGKDFISILFPKCEIIIMLCQEKSNYVIDVLVRAENNTQENTLSTLAFVQKRIINTLITICAQPTGIQGVKLIESVIRPDCLCDPSNTQKRSDDQCVKITYLKEQLQEKLEEGKEEFYDWKRTKHMSVILTSSLIDLLGSEYYDEVFNSCKQWFELEVQDALQLENEVNVSGQYQSRDNVITTNLENDLVQEGQTSEDMVEVQCCKFMVRSMNSLHRKVDSNHEELLKLHDKMDEMTKNITKIHEELRCMKEDVIRKVEKSVSKLLEMALDNEAEKQLPRVAFLMFNFSNSKLKRLLRWVPQFSEGEFVTIHLYCEHKKLPHPVKDQPGITLTCLSESRLRTLNRALPYINGFLRVLIIAARLGISSVVPIASSLIPDWSLQFKQLANGYPMIQNTIKSKKDTYLSTLESASKEWQKCLALILEENGGLSEENISKKFLLKCANYEVDGRTQVAWLCETHYKEKNPFH